MKIRSRLLAKVVAWIVVTVIRLNFATCRKIVIASDSSRRIDVPTEQVDRWVVSVWHDELLMPTFVPPEPVRSITCCLVSRHQDGSYLAETMSLLKFRTVRGSSQRGGAQAVREIMESTAGLHIVITPDGPRGPRRVMKPGLVFLASHLGRVIIPSASSATRQWSLKASWTDLKVPKPFSTIYVMMGSPLVVPPNLSRDELDRYVILAQDAMIDTRDRLDRIMNGQEQLPEWVTAPDRSVPTDGNQTRKAA